MFKNDKIDENLKNALLKKANGYDYEEKIIEANKEGKPLKIKVIKKHVPPDLNAIKEIDFLKGIGRW